MAGTEQRYSYRPTPQVSANQMAEYLGATAPRRTNIIREARFPKTSVVAQYDRARSGVRDFLADGTRSANHFASAVDYLQRRERRPGASPWVVRDSRFSIEAIETFERGYNRMGLPKINCRACHGRQPHLVVGPIRISVALDVTTHKMVLDGAELVGGAILVFSRGERSSTVRIDRCRTIAGLIYMFAGSHLAHLGEADPAMCFSVDVFDSKLHRPPGTFVRKSRQIAESCEEIGDRWWRVQPPSDYDGPAF